MNRLKQLWYHFAAACLAGHWDFHWPGMKRAMLNWRRIPHPTYGNCGGGSLECQFGDHQPIDGMDMLFLEHDTNLWLADQMDTPYQIKLARKEADNILLQGLKAFDVKTLKKPFYGRIYRLSAIAVFSVRVQWG